MSAAKEVSRLNCAWEHSQRLDYYTVVFCSSLRLYLAIERAMMEARCSSSGSHSSSAVWHRLMKDRLCVKQIAQTSDAELLLLRVGVGTGTSSTTHTTTATTTIASMTSQARIKVEDEDVVLECYHVTKQVLDEAQRMPADAIWLNEFCDV